MIICNASPPVAIRLLVRSFVPSFYWRSNCVCHKFYKHTHTPTCAYAHTHARIHKHFLFCIEHKNWHVIIRSLWTAPNTVNAQPNMILEICHHKTELIICVCEFVCVCSCLSIHRERKMCYTAAEDEADRGRKAKMNVRVSYVYFV